VPDYAGGGEGLRIEEVRAGTPAARAGLRAGDVINALNGAPVSDLRDYTRVLRELAPGDAVEIVFMRGGVEHRLGASVVERR